MSMLLGRNRASSMWICFREVREDSEDEHWMNRLAGVWTSHPWRERLVPRPYGRVSHVEVCFELEDGSFRRCSIMKRGQVYFRASRSPNLWRGYTSYAVPAGAASVEAARAFCEDAARRGAGFNGAGFFLQFLLWPVCLPGSATDTFFCVEVAIGALRAAGIALPDELAAGSDGRTSPNALFDCVSVAFRRGEPRAYPRLPGRHESDPQVPAPDPRPAPRSPRP